VTAHGEAEIFTTIFDSHFGQPAVHRSAEFNFHRPCIDGFRLQIEENQACDRTIWKAGGLVVGVKPTLDPEFYATTVTIPDSFLDRFMGKCRHREAGVCHADPMFLVAHDGKGSVKALTMKLVGALGPGFLDPMTQDQLVNLAHRRAPAAGMSTAGTAALVKSGLYRRKLLVGYSFLSYLLAPAESGGNVGERR
jgi:hypothetical protein